MCDGTKEHDTLITTLRSNHKWCDEKKWKVVHSVSTLPIVLLKNY